MLVAQPRRWFRSIFCINRFAIRSAEGSLQSDVIAYRLAGYLLQSFFGPHQFLAHAARCGERKVGMAPGVVPNQVACLRDAPHQLRFGLRVPAHHKERNPHTMAGEDVEQTRRPGRVGPVVEGKRQFPGPGRRNQHSPKDARAGPHRRIRAPARRQTQSGCDAKPSVNLCSQWRKHSIYQCATQRG